MGDENLLLYLNLTGELFYIVAHRMKSQRVKVELAKKVFNDLGMAICGPSRIQALINGDISLISMRFEQVKVLMDQIAHCSIMTVNQYSLEKLFELTMIATKYQFTIVQNPRDILLIILNHLDSLRRVLTDLPAVRLAEDLHNILVITYGRASVSEMKNYLNSIRNYVQEVRLKMTNLIKLGLQTPNGEFVTRSPDFWIHPDCVKPGEIETVKKGRFGQKSKKILATFDAQNASASHRLQSSLALNGNRIIFLGNSIYDREGPSISYDDQHNEGEDAWGNQIPDADPQQQQRIQEHQLMAARSPQPLEQLDKVPEEEHDEESDLLDVFQAVQGLDLCSQMLGCQIESNDGGSDSFIVSRRAMKSYEEPSSTATTSGRDQDKSSCDENMMGVNVVQINARSARLDGLAAIAKQFDVDDEKILYEESHPHENDLENDEDNMYSP